MKTGVMVNIEGRVNETTRMTRVMMEVEMESRINHDHHYELASCGWFPCQTFRYI